jgi:hypothetical protein
MIAVSLFDVSGTVLKPWADAGYECHTIDIQHPSDDSLRLDGMRCHNWDLSTYPKNKLLKLMESDEIAFLACHPPCTSLAVSGSRWMAGKGLRVLQEAIGFFATSTETAELLGCPYYIENPVSTIASYWRPSDFNFNPCDYSGYADDPISEDFTKRTHLWVGGGFVMPPRKRMDDMFDMMDMPDNKYIHHQAPGPERANIRSKSPEGWSRAVFEANHVKEDIRKAL